MKNKDIINRQRIILGLIVLLAFFLRFWQLSEFPVGFHIDEASLGYNAYSLLKTGRDENNQFLPLQIDMFGDFRPAGYQYLTILPVAIFGLTEFATRFMSAFFGALTVIAIYFLSREIFKNLRVSSHVSLIASLLLAVSPWHLAISRASAETIVALFLIILGIYFWLKGLENKSRLILLGIALLSLSYFFYHTPRVFVPMLVLALNVIYYPVWKKKKLRPVLLASGLLVVLAFFLVFGVKGGTGRFKQVSIFYYPEIRLVLEEQIREAGLFGAPVYLTRIIHNKIINYSLGFVKEYFRYFSPNFLFIDGGLPAWYVIPNMGLMYLIELPFLLIGVYLLVAWRNKNHWYLVPIIWLFLGPTVAALTRDDVPNVQRSLIMLPALIMITTYGFWQSWIWARKKLGSNISKLAMLMVALALLWNFGYFLHQYFVHAKIHRPWYRFNGFKEMVLTVDKLSSNYDKILVSKTQGGIYMHFLFFTPYDPAVYQAEGSPKDQEFSGFGKFVFVPDECLDDPTAKGKINPKSKVLLVASGKCDKMPFTGKDAKQVNRPDGTVVFHIYPGE